MTNDDEQSWVLLRERSLRPGGFGEDRARIWPVLLGAQALSDPPPYSEVDSTSEDGNQKEEGSDAEADPHADERQIKLDTDRSFVLYPVESGAPPVRDALQNDLHALLVSLFRKRRSLHYFQGFHDIMTVIFLTLPRPLHLACAEKLALHRIRDSMGVELKPVLGLLRVLRNLLRLADPAYAKLLEITSPLPYHALSHLLTLFSHDVPTLPLIQHVWDFLLSREPIAVVWLAAALILHRKSAVYLLAEQDEEGMIHSLLGGIPELVDAVPDLYDAGDHDSAGDMVIDGDHTAEAATISGRTSVRPRLDRCVESSEQMRIVAGAITAGHLDNEDELSRSALPSNVVQGSDTFPVNNSSPSSKLTPFPAATDQNCLGSRHDSSDLGLAVSIPLPDSRSASPTLSIAPSSPVRLALPSPEEAKYCDPHNLSQPTHDRVPSRSRSLSSIHSRSSSPNPTRPSSPVQSSPVSNSSASHAFNAAPTKSRTRPPPLSLAYLLRQADDLLTTYPPSHPSLRVTEIMGPDSAMRTWRPFPISTKAKDAVPEKVPYDETDDYLETLVDSSHIVIPSPPPSPPFGPRLPAKKMKAPSKALLGPHRIGLLRLGALTPAERRVLFIAALLVVGAAMALKAGKVHCVGGIAQTSGGDGLKRLWNGKWSLISSVVAAWGRGLP